MYVQTLFSLLRKRTLKENGIVLCAAQRNSTNRIQGVKVTLANTQLRTILPPVLMLSNACLNFLDYIDCWVCQGFFKVEKMKSLHILVPEEENSCELLHQMQKNIHTPFHHNSDLIFQSYACSMLLLVPSSPPSCTFSSFRKTGMASLCWVFSSRELPSSVICLSIASNDP